jgi:hypothetical protein
MYVYPLEILIKGLNKLFNETNPTKFRYNTSFYLSHKGFNKLFYQPKAFIYLFDAKVHQNFQ